MKHCKKIARKSYILSLLYSLFILTGIITCASNVQGGTLYAVRESDNTLVSIDTDTLAYTAIGPLGVSFEFGGLAYDPNSQTLYMIGGRGNNNLYTVDRTTGVATLIGSHGINDLFGLAFDSTNNVLYATQFSGGTSLYTLNTTNGASTLIGNMGIGMGGLAYNSATDTLIGVNDGAGNLYSINRTTATVSLVFDGPYTNDSGLEFDPDKNLYWDIDWSGNLISYDIANSFTTTTRLSGLGSHDGLAYLSSGTSAGTISGTITYTGAGTGPISIAAFDGSGCGSGNYTEVWIPAPGPYTLNLSPGTYYICVCRDTNGNGTCPDSNEPASEYDLNPVVVPAGAPVTGIDISLQGQLLQPEKVPTMTEWGVMILIGLLGMASTYSLRRQRII